MSTIKSLKTETHPGILTRAFKAHISVSRDGDIIAVFKNRSIEIIETKTKFVLGVLNGHTDIVLTVTFYHNRKFLASGGNDGNVIIWDVTKLEQYHRFCGIQCSVTALSFSGDGKFLASGTHSGFLHVWDLEAMEQHRNFVTPKRNEVIFLSLDAEILTAIGENGALTKFDVDKNLRISNIDPDVNTDLENYFLLALSLGLYAIATDYRRVTIRDLGNNSFVREITGYGEFSLSQSGRVIALVNVSCDELTVIDTETSKPISKFKIGKTDPSVSSVLVLPDDSCVAYTSIDGKVHIVPIVPENSIEAFKLLLCSHSLAESSTIHHDIFPKDMLRLILSFTEPALFENPWVIFKK